MVKKAGAAESLIQLEGGMAINKPIIHHLLNRMKEFNEWAQVRSLACAACSPYICHA